jgi:tetratricopeptide (TPR) repeat protein
MTRGIQTRVRARVAMSELQMMNRAEELRQAALEKVRGSELEAAIAMYDDALAIADDEELRELITINKADALIGLERSGAEVAALPAIVMRRRNLRHVYLAAYSLQYKCRLDNDVQRARSYGRIAIQTSEALDHSLWKMFALNELGIVNEIDSKFAEAIDCFEGALEVMESSEARDEFGRAYALENLGYCQLLTGDVQTGIDNIHTALTILKDPLGTAEAYVDLCYGYLELGDLERARFYGEAGLEVARDNRQIRNSHYLLGEVAYKTGDSEAADYHFDCLAKFYPDFRHLKSLLYAIDLRSMVNLKL